MKSVFEITKDDEMIIILDPDLLITKKMQVVKRIDDPDAANSNKNQITMLPSFDPVRFPFFAVSGNKTLNILNIKTHMMQTLVDAQVTAYPGQQAFFFKKYNKNY